MADREKVIDGLEHCSEDGCKGCPYAVDCLMADGFSELAKDALELLKEQVELVRCKDCKYNENGRCEKDNIRAHMVDCGDSPLFYVYNDWFCAYGKRR